MWISRLTGSGDLMKTTQQINAEQLLNGYQPLPEPSPVGEIPVPFFSRFIAHRGGLLRGAPGITTNLLYPGNDNAAFIFFYAAGVDTNGSDDAHAERAAGKAARPSGA